MNIQKALLKKKHVLCEKPLCLDDNQAKELFDIAQKEQLILFEAVKTAYSPCFEKLVSIAKSGVIGNIVSLEATFTKLVEDKTLREFDKNNDGGSFSELATYPLCIAAKIFGTNYKNIDFATFVDSDTGVDYFTKGFLYYENAVATLTVGLGVKSNGCCIISGTKGYIYVPAPWWKTEYFEIRFENIDNTQKYFTKFEQDGLRYELAEFISSINRKEKSYKLKDEESVFMAKILKTYLEKYRK